MPVAEGLTFSFLDHSHIQTDLLEAFDYEGTSQYIRYDTPEFSCVCPFSGLPDYGELIMEYVPNKSCVELKSLKYYIVSYRQVGIYQEAATNRLFKDLFTLLDPKYLKIQTIYNPRGGINATCTIEKGEKP